ncbi:MAG TPA: hypothetical protein VF100_13210, partial [Thermoanaerobaculia bacterium]
MRADRPFLLLVAAFLLALVLAGCGRGGDEHHDEHDHADADEHHDEAGEHEDEHGHADAPAGRVELAGVRGVAFSRVGAPVEEGVWRPAEASADEGERVALAAPAAGVVAA